ncbi:tetratricopeptide repeat protein [Geothermobacter ehrlichii]|uniref:Tetratricopeptide repeat protein n=1 Tax=Geothermobacter ehrlichii TaxID=213224 RepID=A0A5D3WNQ2_9BACT|nr:tetratricopeptide repeat protein [Geothermobacter ehrlichii]TYO99963.1 tetratricopeptide repeat protein [Geothermobacter ehrlichii]
MTSDTTTLLGKIAGYTEILAKDPQSTVFVSLAEAYRQIGMLDDALEIAEKGTRSLPRFTPGFVALGRILAQKGNLAEAALAFEKALSIEKDNLRAIKGLARVRFRQGYREKARELLLRGQAIKADDPVIRKMLASLGQEQAPVADAGANDREQPVAKASFGTATGESSGDTAEPEQEPPFLTPTLAELYVKQGLLHDAARVYREILRRKPDNEAIRSRLVALKKRLEAEGQVGTDEPSAGEPSAGEEVDGAPAAEETEAVEPESRGGAGDAVQDEKERLTDIYQRWLAAIDKRRADVR